MTLNNTPNNFDFWEKESYENYSSYNKKYDLYISCYNLEERVKENILNITAEKKIILLLEEYKIKDLSWLEENNLYFITNEKQNEIETIKSLCNIYNLNDCSTICIDITAMLKPYIITIINYLYQQMSIVNFDVIYTEPQKYLHGDDTIFSKGIINTRYIEGFSSIYEYNIDNMDHKHDTYLIVNAGYETKIISSLVQHDRTLKHGKYLIGFPSFKADIYFENILNIVKSIDDFKVSKFNPKYANANDPYETANVLIEILVNLKPEYNNLVLVPIASKTQALGMALFYIFCKKIIENKSISIKYPFSNEYSNNATIGTSKIHRFYLDFNKLTS